MKTINLILVISCFFLLTHCSQKPNLELLKSELLKADQDWAQAAKMGDVAKLTTYWSEDAINFFPGMPPAVGKDSILQLVKINRSQRGFSLSWIPEKAEVANSGDMGYTYGSFQLAFVTVDSIAVNRSGNYVCIWKRSPDKSWKCAIESTIFSSQ